MADSRKDRALKRSAARSAGRTRANIMTPGKVVEGGMSGYAAVRLAQAGIRSAAKAVSRQNKAASTYRTVDPKRSEAAKRAAETRRRNIEAARLAAQATGRKQGAVTGAALGVTASGVGGVAGADRNKKSTTKAPSTSEPNRKQMARNRRKAAARRQSPKK